MSSSQIIRTKGEEFLKRLKETGRIEVHSEDEAMVLDLFKLYANEAVVDIQNPQYSDNDGDETA